MLDIMNKRNINSLQINILYSIILKLLTILIFRIFFTCYWSWKFYTHEISLKNFLYATDVQSDLIPGGHEIIGAAGMFGIQMATIGPC